MKKATMAIYSCNISNVSRGKGSNSCATLSYITGLKEGVYCERTGQTYRYGRNERVLCFETLLPQGAPAEYKDPAVLFNAIENYETAKNARTAKKIMVALPREFNLEQQKDVLREFCSKLTNEGYACTFALHCDEKGNNPHAHIEVVNRQLNSKGEFQTKCKKQYVLDDNGERVPLIDPETGLQKIGKRGERIWKRENIQVNILDTKPMLQNLRSSWANICNEYLNSDSHITEKSHAARGLDIKPTIHEGYAAREIEKRGGWSELCEHNRAVRVFNNALKRLNLEILLKKNERDQLINDSRPTAPTPAQLLRRSKQRQHNEWRGFTFSQKQQVNTPVTSQPQQQAVVKNEPVSDWERGWQAFNEINRHSVPVQQQTPVQPPTPAPPPPPEPPKKRPPQQQQPTGLRARAQQAQRASESQEKHHYNGQTHEER